MGRKIVNARKGFLNISKRVHINIYWGVWLINKRLIQGEERII